MRTRKQLVREAARNTQRIQKALEDANIKITGIVSNILGKSGRAIARVIVAELGFDMSRFPSANHLVSWAGLCPRADMSAGKRRSSRIRHGAPWLKTCLVQCAWAATRTKDTYLRAQFHRLKSRVGSMKAIIAVAASMLTAVFHMLSNGVEYRELGGTFLDRRDATKVAKRLVRRLEGLGLKVTVTEAA